jgi:uncharacterized protein
LPISQQGAINTTALIVPDLYVQIVPPANLILNGVPTNVLGVVGTAQWGPLNKATILGSMADYYKNFGNVMPRKYDMGTACAAAVQQGAANFRAVRVSDGTDVKATSTGVATCFTATALYSGSLGNSLYMALSAGSQAGTWRLIVALPGLQPEVYDNISGTGNQFYLNLAAAVNAGQSVARGPSNLITITAGSGATAAAAATFTFASGTDGVATITAAVLVGANSASRTGMYALTNQGCSVAMLADADDSTQWTTIDGFFLAQGAYVVQVLPAGSTVAGAVTAVQGAGGGATYSTKMMHGDWIWWNDQANNVTRLISPQGFAAGELVNLSPQNSTLNKNVFGVVGSQTSGLATAENGVYSAADLQTLFQAGIDVISNPQPGGTFWGVRAGINWSNNPAQNGDNYTRMTNYIAATLSAGMGLYVGQLINAQYFQNVRSTLMSFCANMVNQGMLASTGTTLPYSVICSLANNPASRTGLGYSQADVAITYQAVNRFFIVNLQGGQTVVTSTTIAPAA